MPRQTRSNHSSGDMRFFEWRCCSHLWQLIPSRRWPERINYQPVCPTCSGRPERRTVMATPMDHGYVMVADRHLKFVEDHPSGSIASKVQHFIFDPSEGKGFVVVNCQVWKEASDRAAGSPPDGEGNASMPIPGPTSFTKNSEVENAETSALGRALAAIGYHPKESMASKEEVAYKKGEPAEEEDPDKPTQKQLGRMFAMAKDAGLDKVDLQAIVLAVTGKRSSKQLKRDDMDPIYQAIEEQMAGDPADKAEALQMAALSA